MTHIASDEWQKAQEFEKEWWGDSINTLGEDLKQLTYAEKMGLSKLTADQRPYFDLKGKSVLDIGGGPSSLLLKCINRGDCFVVDPIPMPKWVFARYLTAGIRLLTIPAEEANLCSCGTGDVLDCAKFGLPVNYKFDEVWIYNCLQHTQDPKRIIKNAKALGKVIRIFEWLETEPHPGHPQTLTEKDLNEWLEGQGRVEILDKKIWTGYCKSYYGVFPTKNYGEIEIK